MTLIVESEKPLKTRAYDLGKRLQEKEKELEKGIFPPITKPGEFSIVQALGQVILKGLELTGFKN